MSLIIEEDTSPRDEMRSEVLRGLEAYNRSVALDDGLQGKYAVYTRDPVSGEVVGGLWASYVYDWMLIELVSLPEASRGQGLGRDLMERAEDHARALGLTGVWLDASYAKGFYEKLGYEICGQIDNFPRGHRRYFLQKNLADET